MIFNRTLGTCDHRKEKLIMEQELQERAIQHNEKYSERAAVASNYLGTSTSLSFKFSHATLPHNF